MSNGVRRGNRLSGSEIRRRRLCQRIMDVWERRGIRWAGLGSYKFTRAGSSAALLRYQNRDVDVERQVEDFPRLLCGGAFCWYKGTDFLVGKPCPRLGCDVQQKGAF